MSTTPQQQLRAYVDYLRDLGIYDLYRREDVQTLLPETLRAEILSNSVATKPTPVATRQPVAAASRPIAAPVAARPVAAVARSAAPVNTVAAPERVAADSSFEVELDMPKPIPLDELFPLPTALVPAGERGAALEAVRAEIGECTRCPLAYAGRHKIVFGDGDANARLMFVGEGPGADEDESGVPFVGKAGELLNNMIGAMGLKREEVYIANIVKCRPPNNRVPEPIEANTCTQFLVKQIDIVRPQIIVALGATAAAYVLGVRQSLGSLRGQWYASRGAKVVVTFHPAYLLRDPRQKGEAWKDLQMVMAEMGLKAPVKTKS